MTRAELEAHLLQGIPLAAAMGVHVAALSDQEACLEAPLVPNVNHKSTAFGGSVHSLAVLSCWSLVTARLSGQDVSYIVIQDSQIRYLKPITGDFSAHAKWSSPQALEKFLAALAKKGLARIQIASEIICRGKICATLTGTFVAQTGTTPPGILFKKR